MLVSNWLHPGFESSLGLSQWGWVSLLWMRGLHEPLVLCYRIWPPIDGFLGLIPTTITDTLRPMLDSYFILCHKCTLPHLLCSFPCLLGACLRENGCRMKASNFENLCCEYRLNFYLLHIRWRVLISFRILNSRNIEVQLHCHSQPLKSQMESFGFL